jgi:hypothetical protein
MLLHFNDPPNPIRLSAQSRYKPEKLCNKLRSLHAKGHKIRLELSRPNSYIKLEPEVFLTVCYIVCYEHDNIVGDNIPYCDGWDEETRQMEERARQHMEEPSSSEEDAGGEETDA